MATATKSRAAKALAAIADVASHVVETQVSAIAVAQAQARSSTDEVIAIGYADGLAETMATVWLHKAANDATEVIAKHFYSVSNYIGHAVRHGHPDMLSAIQRDYAGWAAEWTEVTAANGNTIRIVANAPAVIGADMLSEGVRVVKHGQRPGTENVKPGCFVRNEDEQRWFDRARKMADDRFATPQEKAAKAAQRATKASEAAAKKKAAEEEKARQSAADATTRANGEFVTPETPREWLQVFMNLATTAEQYGKKFPGHAIPVLAGKANELATLSREIWDRDYRDADGEK